MKPHPARVANNDLGAASAGIEHHDRLLDQARVRHGTGKGQARLVVAAEYLHRLAKGLEQLARVGRLANRAGGDDADVAAVVPPGQGEQFIHRSDGRLDRFGLEFAVGIKASAKPCLAAGFEMWRNVAAVQIGDEQLDRVGADVDDAAPHEAQVWS